MTVLRRLLTGVLCLSLILFIAAVPSQAAGYKDSVIIGTPLDITTTDPQGSNTDSNMILFIMTHETLVELDSDGKVVPGLAKFEVIDGNTYKFTLPANATFTDGSPCTTSDVKFTFERAQKSSFTSPKLSVLSGIEVVNDHEIILKTSQPSQEFLMQLAHRSLSILSEKAITAKGDAASNMGTGKYALEKWTPGDAISVVRYDGYHGEKAKTRRIELKLMKEDSSRVIALQTGEIDVCINLPPVEIDNVSTDPDLKLVQVPSVIMLYLTMNNTKPPFDNQKVRQALAHAVNKQDLITVGYDGLGTVHNNMINRGQFGLDPNLKVYDFNLDKAKALLAEAGYPNGFTFDLAYNGSERNLMAQVIQASFAKIGVKVSLQEMESAGLKSMLNERKHVTALYAWTDADGTDFTVRSMYYTGSGSNRSLIANKDIDKLIDDALVEPDVAKREAMYHKLEADLTEICPIIPLNTSIINIGTRAGVDGAVWLGTAKHDYREIHVAQ
ncbi:diguanylate phosphodiesterase [Synergistales bacterium]|nr:diguanylate phosphodiesterase [Synergistales bacterium]